MAKIRVLDQDIANMIAAGEVVERPGSVIKELVENALDAGAKSVTVEIKNGGISYMRVTDDGCGMTKEDAQTCFLRHATSKIQTIADLYAVETLGFRGEALAAISAVSRIELITSTGEGEGTKLELEAGKIVRISEVGAPKGTTIIVRDLFFNTPARMKFLKTDRTEGSYIASLLDRLAIADPTVSFRLIQEGKQTLATYGSGNLQDAIYAVFGKDITRGMLKADGDLDNIRVYGYVGEPTVARGNRNYQLCYINGRLVRSQTVFAAIDQAYRNSLFHGKYAVCVLKITLPAGLVDVNVHPSKMEVKFSNEKIIFNAVYYAIQSALNKQTLLKKDEEEILPPPVPESLIPKAEIKKEDPFQAVSVLEKPEPIVPQQEITEQKGTDKSESVEEYKVSLPAKTHTTIASRKPYIDTVSPDKKAIADQQEMFRITSDFSFREDRALREFDDKNHVNQMLENLKQNDECEIKNTKLEPRAKQAGYRYVGEVFATYLLVEYEDQLYFIDKHAAHERMIFERIQREFDSSDHNGQHFLVPERIRLTPEEVNFAIENRQEFYHIGFDIDAFGDKQIVLRSRPLCLTAESATDAFCEILSNWMSGGKNTLTERENTAMKTLACKAAIKGGNDNDDEELKSLLVDLIKNDNIHQCPHGRPILITHSKKSIEKAFKRI